MCVCVHVGVLIVVTVVAVVLVEVVGAVADVTMHVFCVVFADAEVNAIVRCSADDIRVWFSCRDCLSGCRWSLTLITVIGVRAVVDGAFQTLVAPVVCIFEGCGV